MAIGARSQSARTSLEKWVDEFDNATLDELIVFALRALRDTLPPDSTPGLTAQNCAVGYLGIGTPFRVIENEDEIKGWLDKLPAPNQRPTSTIAGDSGNDGAGAAGVSPSASTTEMQVDPPL